MPVNTFIVSMFCPVFGKLRRHVSIMLLIDFHKYAQKPATRLRSGVVSATEMSLAISIRRTTLSFVCKRPLCGCNEAVKAVSDRAVPQR
ncbi:hypothetical protein AN191_06500 [Loktanella sp. 5RATIMAR09]|uniref:hypothetical protein n=1 Tax=Loktanella sp. 5RATIMAR09 TaxID=1225655 RepID=UPI00070799AC|nr:hypothetical protein [Loktanella sp. 5RATIMAR09]KQI72656.1 hypothetical protein AN191_06500 [Loktanella sp. 5RATIMAR09]